MKKTLALVLALMMIASMSVTAWASSTGSENPATNTGGTTTIEVNGTYEPGAVAADSISAVISWGAMSFTYTGASQGTWNPQTHNYEGATKAVWTISDNEITVTNHSNVAIRATFQFTPEGGEASTVAGVFSMSPLDLASAVGTSVNEAPSAGTKFSVNGSISESGKLGTIEINIAKKQTQQ